MEPGTLENSIFFRLNLFEAPELAGTYFSPAADYNLARAMTFQSKFMEPVLKLGTDFVRKGIPSLDTEPGMVTTEWEGRGKCAGISVSMGTSLTNHKLAEIDITVQSDRQHSRKVNLLFKSLTLRSDFSLKKPSANPNQQRTRVRCIR